MHFARMVRAGVLVPAILVATGLGAPTGATGAAGACRVDYTITTQWPGGFGANVVVTNFGDPLSRWTLEWAFTAGQRVTAEAWNGVFTQTGSTVRVDNASYNGTVATGGSVAFGFNGTWSAANPVPKSFELNGAPCTGLPTTRAAPPPRQPASPAATAPTTTVPTTTATTAAEPTATTAAPPVTVSRTETEPIAQTATPGTFDWPTTQLKSVVLADGEQAPDTGVGSVLVQLVITLLLLTGGIVVLLVMRRRLRG